MPGDFRTTISWVGPGLVVALERKDGATGINDPKPLHDPQFPPAEFSDEEQEGRSSPPVLDDVPISIYKKQVPSQKENSSRPQKKLRFTGLRGDPALKSFSERRAVFDGAMDKTQKHLQRMREKLQPRSVQVTMPTQSSPSQEKVSIDSASTSKVMTLRL